MQIQWIIRCVIIFEHLDKTAQRIIASYTKYVRRLSSPVHTSTSAVAMFVTPRERYSSLLPPLDLTTTPPRQHIARNGTLARVAAFIPISRTHANACALRRILNDTERARQASTFPCHSENVATFLHTTARSRQRTRSLARSLESRILLIYCARAPRSQDTRTNMCRVCTLVLNRSVSCLCGNTYMAYRSLCDTNKHSNACSRIAGALKCRHKHKRAEYTPLMCRRRGIAQSSYWLCCCCWAPVVAIAYTPLL